MIDATKAVARITFKDRTDSLGVLYPGYVLGQPITVQEGQVKYITVYNGAQIGVLQFTAEFSAAIRGLIMGASSLALLVGSFSF